MTSLTIRNLDEPLTQRLCAQAAMTGRSVEDEARNILRAALDDAPGEPKPDLAQTIRARFAPFAGVVLRIPPREPIREPQTFHD